MQDTLRLMILTVFGVVILWFIVMTVDTHVFLHSDIDADVSGLIPINRTDVGAQCGPEYENSTHVLTYKLNTENQIVYLCPLGLWPIRSTVVAANISDAFRKTLTPAGLTKVNAAYPPQQPASATNPANAPAYQPPVANGPMNAAGPGQTAPAYPVPNTPSQAAPPAYPTPAANGSMNATAPSPAHP